MMPEWYFTGTRLSRIKCFITDMMEPYVMVKHTPKTPIFDGRFMDYGYDKVALIEEFRQRNYDMKELRHDDPEQCVCNGLSASIVGIGGELEVVRNSKQSIYEKK